VSDDDRSRTLDEEPEMKMGEWNAILDVIVDTLDTIVPDDGKPETRRRNSAILRTALRQFAYLILDSVSDDDDENDDERSARYAWTDEQLPYLLTVIEAIWADLTVAETKATR
jgi:hypothetical protein